VGRKQEDADRIITEAEGMEFAGAYLVILEHIPESLGRRVTQSVNIPTVGIRADSCCDGQILVINDGIGLGDN
jgi:3-methyl-2-oxobutanoate hydroxymethyltransferase